jgi:hypothetical protein
MHPIPVELYFVQPFRPFRRFLYELRQLWPNPFRQSGRSPSRCRSRHRGLSNLFDRPAPDGQRRKQLCFRPGEIEPRQPVRAVDDDHLSIVNGGHVGAGFGRQECEGVAGASGI